MRVQPGKRPTELAKRRSEAGLRQQDIADRAGISQGRYSGIENGLVDPPLTIARAIAKALAADLDALWPPKPAKRAPRRTTRPQPAAPVAETGAAA